MSSKSKKNKNENDEEVVQDFETTEATETTEVENSEEATETELNFDEEIAKRDAIIAELKDKNVRSLAEFDNFRKRSIKEKSQMYDNGLTEAVTKLLPLIDNFERALTYSTMDKEDAFYKGIEMLLKQAFEIIEQLGIKTIETEGKEFDANLHFAVDHVEDDSVGENVIVAELQKGYILNDKIIRPSMVKVAN